MRVILMILWSSLMLVQAEEVVIKVSGINVNRGGNIVVFIFSEDGLGFSNSQ